MKAYKFITLFLVIAAACSYAQFTNVAIDTNTYDQSEPTIAVSPQNSNYVLAAWNDCRNINGNGNSKPGYAFSTGAGQTWSAAIVTPPNYQNGSDPSVAFDRYGNAFYCYAAFQGSPQPLGNVYVSRTTNLGIVWNHKRVSVLNNYDDKPFISVDNTGDPTKDGRIYVSWSEFTGQSSAIKFSFSTDHGASFSTPVTLIFSPYNPGTYYYTIPGDYEIGNYLDATPGVTGSMPVVAPNGDLYVIWMHIITPGYNESYFEIRKSTDGGVTFGNIITLPNFTFQRRLLGQADIFNLPCLAIDPITSNLYVTYMDQVSEDNDDMRVKFIRSTDGGTLWSTPMTIGDFGVGWQFFPWGAVDENSNISVFFMHSSDLSLIDSYITESYDNGVSFLPPVRVSTQSSDPSQGHNYHYHGAVCSGDNTYCIWTDHRNLNEDPYFSSVGDVHYLATNNISLNSDATIHNNNHILERGYFGKLHEVFSSDEEIFYRRSSDNGDSWDITQRITIGNSSNNHPSIVAAGQGSEDFLCLVWQRKITNTQYEIYTSFSSNSGTSWSEPFSPINVIVSTSQSNPGGGPGTTPVVASYQSGGQKYLLVYATATGLYYRTATFGNDWSAATLVPGSYGLNSTVWYPLVATYNNQSAQVNLIYDDRFTHVYSQIFNGTFWSNRVVVDWVGSYNQTSSIAVDNTNKTLGVWSGWNGSHFVTRFRQGYSDGTWGRWCKEWSASQDGVNFLFPSVTYYKKDLPNPYGIDILWNTSLEEIRQKTYSGLGDTWIPADPNTQIIATSGLFANLTHERENTTKPIQMWTDQSTPPIYSIIYNSEYLPKENSFVEGEIHRAAEITDGSDNSHLRVELSEPVITLTNGEKVKIPFKSYNYLDTLELTTENVFDYLKTELVNIPNNAQSLTFKVEINASQPDTLSDGTLNNNNQTPFRTINFALIARDSSHILLNNIGSHLLNNLSGIHHYSRELTVNALALRGKNIRTLPNITLGGTFNSNNLYFSLVNVSIEGYGAGKGSSETNNIIPTEFSLEQNYPNPFNPSTNIRYSVITNGLVTLKVYDVLGREIAVLVNDEKNEGIYEVEFNAKNLSSGIYFYQFKTKEYVATKKMILLR